MTHTSSLVRFDVRGRELITYMPKNLAHSTQGYLEEHILNILKEGKYTGESKRIHAIVIPKKRGSYKNFLIYITDLTLEEIKEKYGNPFTMRVCTKLSRLAFSGIFTQEAPFFFYSERTTIAPGAKVYGRPYLQPTLNEKVWTINNIEVYLPKGAKYPTVLEAYANQVVQQLSEKYEKGTVIFYSESDTDYAFLYCFSEKSISDIEDEVGWPLYYETFRMLYEEYSGGFLVTKGRIMTGEYSVDEYNYEKRLYDNSCPVLAISSASRRYNLLTAGSDSFAQCDTLPKNVSLVNLFTGEKEEHSFKNPKEYTDFRNELYNASLSFKTEFISCSAETILFNEEFDGLRYFSKFMLSDSLMELRVEFSVNK